MAVRRLQFTISQLAFLVINMAIFCAMSRSSKWPYFGAFIIGFCLFTRVFGNRPEAEMGFLGCTAVGLMVMGGFLIGVVSENFVQVSLSGKLVGLGGSTNWLIQSALGLLVGAVVGIAIYLILALAKQYIDRTPVRPLRDDSCGPIVWRRLDDTPAPSSDSR